MINLHIFNDPIGFFTSNTIKYISKIQDPNRNIYLNLQKNNTSNDNRIINSTVKQFITQYPEIVPDKVIFHSFHYYNGKDIDRINARYKNANIKYVWIMWSHEYYQLPHNFKTLYTGLSRKFLFRKHVSFAFEYFRHFIKGNVNFPIYTGLKSVEKNYKKLDYLCSFIKGDYDLAMKNTPEVKYHNFIYLSTDDFFKQEFDFNLMNSDIIIGHSGSPIVRHYEIVEQLNQFEYKGKITIPFSYGKKEYMELFKKRITKFDKLDIELIEDYLSKDEYYQKIDSSGIFILNSHCQQGLGNIVYFLWNGTKVFISEKSSTYTSFKKLGFIIFSIENQLTKKELSPLSTEEKNHNHNLLYSLLNPEKVKKEWLEVLSL